MANPYINIFKDNPTEGAKDGTYVSTSGIFTAPILAVLNSEQKYLDRMKDIKLAIRAEAGYKTVGETEIYTNLVTDDLLTAREFDNFNLYWETIRDSEGNDITVETGDFHAGIKLVTLKSISSKNKIFWLRISAEEGEEAKIDKSVRIVVKGEITRE